MASEMIELECPSCSELLELDLGFAGGVCRCSACGTLMTVPKHPGRERAEALSRPDRPDAPGGGSRTRSRRPDAPRRPETPGRITTAEAEGEEEEPAGRQTYVTSTGRVITLDDARHIPTAGKRQRKGVRIATVAVFCSVVGLILAASIYAIVTLATTKPTVGPDLDDPTQRALRLFTFDEHVNPLTIEHPNVLGLPMSKKTAIVFDMLDAPPEAQELAAKVLAATLDRSGVKLSVAIVGTDATKPLAYNGGMTGLSSISPAKLAKFLTELQPKDNQLAAAVAQAAATNPDQLVIITSQRLKSADAGPVFDAVASRPTLPVDVMMLQNYSSAMEDLARNRDGTHVLISTTRLQAWIEEADAK